jgi:hypothetical protein
MSSASLPDWCLSYSLTHKDIFNLFLLFSVILNVYALAAYALITSTKRLAWCLSLLNSGVMCFAGSVYIYAKLVKHPHAFIFGHDGPLLLYGVDNLSVIIW